MSNDTAAGGMYVGTCTTCEKPGLLVGPLHAENGGPVMCMPCGIEWHAEHARARKYGRILVKAMKAFFDAGGSWKAIDRFQSAAIGMAFYDSEADTLGAAIGDITLELLEDTVRLTHPDMHPPERKERAGRVTQELLALKPFVFPKPKEKVPEPVETPPSNASSKVQREPLHKLLRQTYPCDVCVDQVPYYYCKACRIEYEKRWQAKKDAQKAKQHAYRLAKKAREAAWRALRRKSCAVCSSPVKSKRKDARYCSPACRQRAHRGRVTENKKRNGADLSIRDAASQAAA